jgi:NADPH:quinone reductase-like Zn-dependent oxidoreductase
VLAFKPASLTYEQAAAIPFGGTTALYFLRKATIKKGQQVLIYGASGAVGTAAVQLAKYFGAIVTAVCSSDNLAMVKSLGADFLIDYTKEDLSGKTNTYDIVFDCVGKSPFTASLRAMKSNGYYLRVVHMSLPLIIRGIFVSMMGNKKVIGGVTRETPADLDFLNGLIEEGWLKPVIDKTYPIEQMVAAHHYVEKGHKKGNVIITIS